MTELDSPKQINEYDCGIYILIYAGMLANNIAKGVHPKMMNIKPAEGIKWRTLRQRINLEKGRF